MTIVDIVLLVMIISAVAGAAVHCFRNRGKCSCSGCCGDCSQCHGKI
ncbi:MAG: hypothetical protein K6F71_04715 [Ruminococcus sp.]|nr:hypothetical protein [Ruminococcus sp.]MCR5540117.1 hypothetical protein [Ruminococcus sp.]